MVKQSHRDCGQVSRGALSGIEWIGTRVSASADSSVRGTGVSHTARFGSPNFVHAMYKGFSADVQISCSTGLVSAKLLERLQEDFLFNCLQAAFGSSIRSRSSSVAQVRNCSGKDPHLVFRPVASSGVIRQKSRRVRPNRKDAWYRAAAVLVRRQFAFNGSGSAVQPVFWPLFCSFSHVNSG